jgi:hypothetical protein
MMVTARFGHRPVIEVLHVQDCPNYPQALALVEQAHFLGSPTIRVDGRDLQPSADRS